MKFYIHSGDYKSLYISYMNRLYSLYIFLGLHGIVADFPTQSAGSQNSGVGIFQF